MGHKVSIELATRAIIKLEEFPAEVQQAFERQLLGMARTLGKRVDATQAYTSPAILPRLVQLEQGHERVYRVLFGVRDVDYYITFRWPKKPEVTPPANSKSVLLVLSLGNWEDKFRAWCKKRQRGY